MTTLSRDRLARLTDRLERDVAAGSIAGASVLVGGGEGVFFEASVGYRDRSTNASLGPDAIWRIYSMTKPLVTVAAMILVEAGEIRLNQSVADLIPSFATLRLMAHDGSSAPTGEAITIQDLMRHTSGMTYGYLGDGAAHRALLADGVLREDLPLADFVDRLAALPLEHPPGRVWHYSHATDVLARVLEVVTGKTVDAALAGLLLDPLGMRETRFRWPTTARDRVAQPLGRWLRPGTGFYDPTMPRRLMSGGGGLSSTGADYCRFLQMLLSGGRFGGQQVLGPATVRLMTSDHLGPNIGRGTPYFPGPGYGFGLGFAVRTVAGEAAYPGSVGDYHWSGVGGTAFWVDPTSDFFAVFLLQSGSVEQRLHYRTLVRNMIYAAADR